VRRTAKTAMFLAQEIQMSDDVEVIIPVDAEAAQALKSPARREAAGR